MKRQTIPLRLITRDHRFQARAALDAALVDEYARLDTEGVRLPPLEVMEIDGVAVLIDGFHRLVGYERNGRDVVDVELTEGTEAEAYKRAAIVNAAHGKRRNHDDTLGALEMAFSYLGKVDDATFQRDYRDRPAYKPKPSDPKVLDGWTHSDVAILAGVSLDVVTRNRRKVFAQIEHAPAILERESGFAARRRDEQSDGRQRANAQHERESAAQKDATTSDENAALVEKRERYADEFSEALTDEQQRLMNEVPLPFLHDNYIGQDLMRGGVKMMDGLGVWNALKKEYGETRLREYVLRSSQLRGDMQLWLRGVRRVEEKLTAMLVGAEEALSV